MRQRLEQEINELHAEVCVGLADPKRIMILYELADRSMNVTELAQALDTPQPSVSRHLKVLRERGMVLSEREGASVYYRLGDARLIEALDLLRAFLRARLSHRADLVEVMPG